MPFEINYGTEVLIICIVVKWRIGCDSCSNVFALVRQSNIAPLKTVGDCVVLNEHHVSLAVQCLQF